MSDSAPARDLDALETVARSYTCKVCRMEAMTGEALETFFGVGHTHKRGCKHKD